MNYVLNTEFPSQEMISQVQQVADAVEKQAAALAVTRKAVADAATGTASSTAQNDIAAEEARSRALANDLQITLKSLKDVRAAGEKYRKDSPTIEDRKTAEEDVRAKTKRMKETAEALLNAENVLSSARGILMGATDEGRAQAQANVAVAQTARDNAKTADDKAAKEFREAKEHLADINRRMKAAEEAWSAEVARAKPEVSGVRGSGDEVPGAGAGATDPGSTTAGAPSKPGGPSKPVPAPATAAAAKPGAGSPSGSAKPTGTTAAPAGAKTTDAGSKGSDDPALASILANLRSQGQTSQTGQAQPAAGAPVAAPSTGAGTGKPGQGDGGGQGSGLNLGRPWDLPDVAAAAGVTTDWLNGKERPTAAPTTTPAPATTAAPAASPAAKLAGAVPSTPTTGTSVTGVSTTQDVSGRSTPTPSAYSPAPGGATTSTSAAHGTGTGAGGSTAGSPTGRAGTGMGMPMMPMMPGAGGGAGGASGDRKPIEKSKVSDEVSLLNGEASLSEAVEGGTIGQRRD